MSGQASTAGGLRTVEAGRIGVPADERKVKQVVFNLLSNAVKFTPEGGQVDVRARNEGDTSVAVRDTGIGIAPEDQGRIFEEFQRGTGARAEGPVWGCRWRRLCRAARRAIWVESELGAGSTFSFTIPLAHARPRPSS